MKVQLKKIPAINKIINSNETQLDKECLILAEVLNKPLKEIQRWKFYKLNYYRSQIQFLFQKNRTYRVRKYLFVNFRIYKRVNEVEHFTTDRLLSIKTYVRNGIDNNIVQLAALCYKPLFSEGLDYEGNEKDMSYKVISKMEKDFANIDYRRVAGAVFFFCEVSQILNPLITYHINEATKEMEILNKESTN